MADIEFTQDVTQDRSPDAQSGGFGMVANLAGAVVSLALLVGVGVWAYKLMVRDVSGVPVVRALEGPMRVQPENPGGRPADHQGLAVNAVAADGSAAAPADRLILAPRPVDLASEDTSREQLSRSSGVSSTDAEKTTQAAEIDALVAQITAGVEQRDDVEPVPTVSSDREARIASDPIVAPEPLVIDAALEGSVTPPATETIAAVDRELSGLSVSPRPLKRPAGGVAAVVTPAALQTVAPDLDIDPAEVPTGTRVVQLGAYESSEIARLEWDRLAARFGDYMQGKQRIVQQASSGGRTFYRLRVHGFDDLSDARRFCSALVAEGADCIPVVTR